MNDTKSKTALSIFSSGNKPIGFYLLPQLHFIVMKLWPLEDTSWSAPYQKSSLFSFTQCIQKRLPNIHLKNIHILWSVYSSYILPISMAKKRLHPFDTILLHCAIDKVNRFIKVALTFELIMPETSATESILLLEGSYLCVRA